MKRFNYETAINQLGLDKKQQINTNIYYDKIPQWVQVQDFLYLFLPFLKIYGDSREQDKWIENACKYYGIAFEWLAKNQKAGTENLKEGDYTYSIIFGNKEYNYVNIVVYERKGAISEYYSNCINGRDRIKREFVRFNVKQYDKVVLMLQFGEKLTDLINMKFKYYNKYGEKVEKDTGYTMYSTTLSWKQPNHNNFDVIQSSDKVQLFWIMLQDMFYYFRQELRLECIEKNLIEILE